MKNNVKKSMKKATIFYEANKSYILKQLKHKGELISVELDTKALANQFDMKAGIDYVFVNHELGSLQGVAARVNFWWKTKGHLTIRYKRKTGGKTEYEKRIKSINGNSMYPNLTMQMDSTVDKKIEKGIILLTKDLYQYIDANKKNVIEKYMNVCSEGNNYLSIPYSDIKNKFNVQCKVF